MLYIKNNKNNSEELEESCEKEDAGSTQSCENVAYISGVISADTVDDVVAFIIHHNIVRTHDRIIIFVNSPGGSLNHGFALTSVIESSLLPVITVAIGECESSGLIIAMSGHIRLVAENCSILSHQYSAGFGMTKHVDIMARQKNMIMTAEMIVDHYEKHTGIDRAIITTELLNDHDVFLSAKEAIDFNMFDGLFVNFDQLNFSFEETPLNETVDA